MISTETGAERVPTNETAVRKAQRLQPQHGFPSFLVRLVQQC